MLTHQLHQISLLVTIRRNLKAVLGQFAQYEVCYGNMFHTQESAYNVVSTGFTIEGVTGTVYLADEVINREKGRIFFFTYTEGGTPNIVKKNAGTVDYMTGEVLIDTVNILSTVIANGVIEIQAIPHSNDIVGLRDLYVKFDMTNTTINMIQDLIASGENTSGSRFVHTHSYYTPTFHEKIKFSSLNSCCDSSINSFFNCNYNYNWWNLRNCNYYIKYNSYYNHIIWWRWWI